MEFKKNWKKLEKDVDGYLITSVENDKEYDSFRGAGLVIIIQSNLIDIYTRSEVLPELWLSGHTDTLTEASNLIEEVYKTGEIQDEQHYNKSTLLKNLKVEFFPLPIGASY